MLTWHWEIIASRSYSMRFDMNSTVEIDRNRNVGITSTLKNYVTVPTEAWFWMPTGMRRLLRPDTLIFVSLYVLLEFCEDYKHVVINSRVDFNTSAQQQHCLTGDPATEPTLELFKVHWRMPHVLLSEINKLSMLRALESGQYLSMAFRSWDLYEFPLLQSTTKYSWTIKTATQLEKPRYVISLCKQVEKTSYPKI